jgi:hypothetical protein
MKYVWTLLTLCSLAIASDQDEAFLLKLKFEESFFQLKIAQKEELIKLKGKKFFN